MPWITNEAPLDELIGTGVDAGSLLCRVVPRTPEVHPAVHLTMLEQSYGPLMDKSMGLVDDADTV